MSRPPPASLKLAPPVPFTGTQAQYAELVRLASEGWIVPVALGSRVIFRIVPEPASTLTTPTPVAHRPEPPR